MFAILIAEENLSKIEAAEPFKREPLGLSDYLASVKKWYYVTGFVGANDRFYEQIVLPEYVIVKHHQYDPDKIDVDWDQIVRL